MNSSKSGNHKVRVVPVVDSLPADLLTPLAVYLALSGESRYSFLFESVEGGRSLARYSFIGAEPFNVVAGGKEEFRQIRDHLSAHVADAVPDLPPFIGGAVGYIGFDACEWFEPSLSSAADLRSGCEFMLYRSVAAFDHAKQIVSLITLAFIGPNDDIEVEIANAQARNQAMAARIGRPIPGQVHAASTSAACEANWVRKDFEAAVSQIQEYIAAGDCYQAVLSQRFEKHTEASPVAIYRALRSLNPSPYMFLMQFGERAVVGASPEMLVRCHGRELEYRPIAGTRKRGVDAVEDDSLAREMSQDKKEVAEHMMLVDLGRNDLGRVAEYGSVEVRALMRVEKYSHVQHLVSSLTATLRSGLDRFDALAACFPAGTVSGAPKVRAVEIIRDLEPTPRSVYAGAVGYFDYAGNMDTCIAIRTIELENGRAYIQAGAGIVADSVPHLEFEETVNKAQVMLKAIEIAEAGGR